MVLLTTDVIVALAVIAVFLIVILVILLICCLCRKCDQCERWSRNNTNVRQDANRERVIAESRAEFNEIRAQHDAVRDQLRVKYNLNGDQGNVAVVVA